MSLLLEERTGEWLVAHRVEMERGEAVWLERLAEFDLAGEWAADGQYACVDWLSWRLKMTRSTAYEKLQVAHELRRRPILVSAFQEGSLSYSAVRVITRLDDPDPEVDEALVVVAETGTVAISKRRRASTSCTPTRSARFGVWRHLTRLACALTTTRLARFR